MRPNPCWNLFERKSLTSEKGVAEVFEAACSPLKVVMGRSQRGGAKLSVPPHKRLSQLGRNRFVGSSLCFLKLVFHLPPCKSRGPFIRADFHALNIGHMPYIVNRKEYSRRKQFPR